MLARNEPPDTWNTKVALAMGWTYKERYSKYYRDRGRLGFAWYDSEGRICDLPDWQYYPGAALALLREMGTRYGALSWDKDSREWICESVGWMLVESASKDFACICEAYLKWVSEGRPE